MSVFESLPKSIQKFFSKLNQGGPSPFIDNVPQGVEADAGETIDLDFSDSDIQNLGNLPALVRVSVSEGTLEASNYKGAFVFGSGGDTLIIIGAASRVKNFFEDGPPIQFTSETGGPVELNLDVFWEGVFQSLGSTTINEEDPVNSIVGTEAADELTGDAGQDSITGLGDDDLLKGQDGDDTIEGNGGNDTIIGGRGADEMDGGDGDDVLQYFGVTEGVVIDLNLGGDGNQQASGGDAEGDVIRGFEHVYGSDFADVITGDDGRNILFGYGGADVISGGLGDDVIRGGEGADTMDGGDGIDWLRYLESSTGVNVNLETLEMSGGDAEGDVISNFENVQGSEWADAITGDANANYILGFEGDDDISGGGGRDTIRGGEGADTIDGGDDVDTLQYTGATAGVTVNLRTGLGSGGDAEGDVFSNIENVYTTEFDDVLIGGEGRNYLYGYGGDDILNGGEGKDVLRGFDGADQFVFDTTLAASNVDRILDFEAGIDLIMLANAIFVELAEGALNAAAFYINTGGVAETADHRIIYDNATGSLYYDADGNGTGEAEMFASLTSLPTLDETDFFIF